MMYVFFLSIAQNVAFTIMSRSRNRSNLTYHAVASVFSNGIWFMTMKELVLADMTMAMILPYIAGTTIGSLAGGVVSMKIEKAIGAKSDL